LLLLFTQIEDAIQPVDIAMKNVLYSMLSSEGSYKSQMVCILQASEPTEDQLDSCV